MKCGNPECGKEFVQKKSSHRYCCDRCRERALYLRKLVDGRAQAELAAKRARRAQANAGKPKRQPKNDRGRKRTVSQKRLLELEWEMRQPREELLKYSERWTKEEHKAARKIYEKQHRLFRCVYS